MIDPHYLLTQRQDLERYEMPNPTIVFSVDASHFKVRDTRRIAYSWKLKTGGIVLNLVVSRCTGMIADFQAGYLAATADKTMGFLGQTANSNLNNTKFLSIFYCCLFTFGKIHTFSNTFCRKWDVSVFNVLLTMATNIHLQTRT